MKINYFEQSDWQNCYLYFEQSDWWKKIQISGSDSGDGGCGGKHFSDLIGRKFPIIQSDPIGRNVKLISSDLIGRKKIFILSGLIG